MNRRHGEVERTQANMGILTATEHRRHWKYPSMFQQFARLSQEPTTIKLLLIGYLRLFGGSWITVASTISPQRPEEDAAEAVAKFGNFYLLNI